MSPRDRKWRKNTPTVNDAGGLATLIDALLPNAQPAITWFNAESLNHRSHTGTGLSTVENSCKVSVAAALPAKATANRARKLSVRDL